MLKEYLEFLKEYKIVGLALGVVIGTASTKLVNSLVDHIIMPIVSVFIPQGGWRQAILEIGPIKLAWGPFLAELLNFLILALAVFIVVKKILKWENIKK